MSAVKCFVVGCSRSGTTLLSVLLDRHSLLAVPPETAFYRDLAIHFRNADRGRATELLSAWRRLPELGLEASSVIEACGDDLSARRVIETILSLYAGSRGKRYCGEKTPGHFRSIPTILDDFPDAKILFLMRDGRDTALSLVAMPFWTRDLSAATALWIRAAETCRELLAKYPDRVALVRYENLASEPEAVLDVVMRMLALSPEAEQLRSDVLSGVVLTRSMDWKGRAMQAVDTARIGHWRRTASVDEASYLNRTMRNELLHFGYEA